MKQQFRNLYIYGDHPSTSLQYKQCSKKFNIILTYKFNTFWFGFVINRPSVVGAVKKTRQNSFTVLYNISWNCQKSNKDLELHIVSKLIIWKINVKCLKFSCCLDVETNCQPPYPGQFSHLKLKALFLVLQVFTLHNSPYMMSLHGFPIKHQMKTTHSTLQTIHKTLYAV